tara:strand:- start:257 stop:511 length:255 start_codon:yes stop_codon:yes gene_type:complete
VSEEGHNSAGEQLRLLIERIETLEEEKKGVAGDIKDIYIEGKSRGYDVKILREVVRLRKMANDDRNEHFALLDTYSKAIGMDLL